MNIAVMCSGSGTNLQAIIDAVADDRIKAKIALVLSDREGAFAIKRAERAGIPAIVIDPKKHKGREKFDEAAVRALKKHGAELVVLAGYMRIVGRRFVSEYRNRMMNIHPALLPSFKGSSAIKDALAHGAKVTGATVHFVTEELDNGPIILQKAVEIKEGDTEESLLERVHRAEHEIYPEAVKLFVEGNIRVEGRRVIITKGAK